MSVKEYSDRINRVFNDHEILAYLVCFRKNKESSASVSKVCG